MSDDQVSEHDVPRNAAAEIDTLLYSDRSPEEMLAALSPYIRLRDTFEAVSQRTGLTFRETQRHIAAPPQYASTACGLCFSTAEAVWEGKVRRTIVEIMEDPSLEPEWGVVRIWRLERIVAGRLFREGLSNFRAVLSGVI